jgi:signal transduction histidine kinase
MNQGSVLIYSDEAEFSRMVVNRWNMERSVPAFTVMGSAASEGVSSGAYDLAILGAIRSDVLRSALKRLEALSRPVLVIAKDARVAQLVRDSFPRFLVLRDHLGWVDAAVPLGCEVLRRAEVAERARRAEEKAAASEHHATLGRYMLEMRHSVNNALTSVLGNAELLLMEPGAFSAEMRDQINTIHSMAMRIHEIVHRFSSLETEMSFAEKESQSETESGSRAFVSGA